jgi:DNA invertase Pin-like site-specific DNA recombinase
MKYGYARVSTDGQSVDAQVRQLTKAGGKKVFREVASGAKSDRAHLRRAIDVLEPGDVLIVTRLDRLARSTRDLLNRSRRSPIAKPDSDRSATRGPTPRHRTGG